MTTCYRCEKCGKVFNDYDEACKHENGHFIPKTWVDTDDEKVIKVNMEWIPELYAPSAVVVPMSRDIYDEDVKEWKTETIYVKYFYSAKQSAEQVFPVDESIIK